MPQLLGLDRAEPSGPAIEGFSAVPSLWCFLEVGLPGLPPRTLDRRTEMRLRASPCGTRAAGATFCRGPARVPAARPQNRTGTVRASAEDCAPACRGAKRHGQDPPARGRGRICASGLGAREFRKETGGGETRRGGLAEAC